MLPTQPTLSILPSRRLYRCHLSDFKLLSSINILKALKISGFWQPRRHRQMMRIQQYSGILFFSILYYNIYKIDVSLPLKGRFLGSKGSETAKIHDFLILSPQIVNFGLSEFWWEKLQPLRGCHSDTKPQSS